MNTLKVTVHVKTRKTWVRLTLPNIETANEVAAQWRERGFMVFVEVTT
jgi:hypothetical protein